MIIEYVHCLGSEAKTKDVGQKFKPSRIMTAVSYICTFNGRHIGHHLMSTGIACFVWRIGRILLALDVAVSATFCSRSDFILRRYANRTTNKISILWLISIMTC